MKRQYHKPTVTRNVECYYNGHIKFQIPASMLADWFAASWMEELIDKYVNDLYAREEEGK